MYVYAFSVKIAAGALVCDECELVGDITIGRYKSCKLSVN